MRKNTAKTAKNDLPKGITTIAIDLAKNVFQIAGENKRQQIIFEERIRGREAFIAFLERLPTNLTVLMETGASAQYYARTLQARGVAVRILPAQHVTRHRHGGKNDRSDTHAILRAGRDQSIRAVPVKSPDMQALQTIHRVRSRHIDNRTALSNQLRGILLEHNIAVAPGHKALDRTLNTLIADDSLPDITDLLIPLHSEWLYYSERIKVFTEALEQHAKNHPVCKRLMEIPGIGAITATAIVAKCLDPERFPNARKFAAYFGIVPDHNNSGNTTRPGNMSKRGDKYIRSLLIEGAHAVINHLKAEENRADKQRLQRWVKRHGRKGAAIRLANHNLRVIWKLLQDDSQRYNPDHRSTITDCIAEQGENLAA